MPTKQSTSPIWARIDHITATRGIARYRLYALITRGEIEAAKDGRSTLINVATVDAYLQRQRVTSFPAADEMRRRRQAHQKRVQTSSVGSVLVPPKVAA